MNGFMHVFESEMATGKKQQQRRWIVKLSGGNGSSGIDTNSLYPSNVLVGAVTRFEMREKAPGGNTPISTPFPTLLYSVDYDWSYQQIGQVGCLPMINSSYNSYRVAHCSRKQLDSEVHTYYNDGGSDTYRTNYLSHDIYGLPSITETSSNTVPGHRYQKQTYHHDTDNWMLKLPAVKYIHDGSS
jgi:hypothetical protein